MPDINGIDFLTSLPEPPMVIFTTAYSEHAVQSFELDAIDYLLKPFSLARFLKACNKSYALQQFKQEKVTPPAAANFIFVKSGYEQFRVELDEVLYLESAGNYVNFVFSDRKLLSRLSMQEAVALLPATQFTRVHRSYIVANNKVQRIDRNYLYVNQFPISIGAAYADAVEKVAGGKLS
ncbi:LytTR family DNA-binding domain-containing protein [Chitinophaga sedimenti]|uniref:LytR/AlgR family response regulator transcription factor n=1 Tax=Chitinophaga sedimenti TaxID=2033606 RepID=UPI0020054F45|nr:LytTR family DNA-binding domain-containing protein [Chitinophaga sedimenti]MCK7554384.1 LytTR family DNA-binding domain-containing protein [Chitinophaga sedimenti]